MQGFDAGFEDLGGDELADFGGDGGGGREDGYDGAEDARDEAAGAVVVHAEGVRAEEDDGFEDGGRFEDEVAEGGRGGGGDWGWFVFGMAVFGGFGYFWWCVSVGEEGEDRGDVNLRGSGSRSRTTTCTDVFVSWRRMASSFISSMRSSSGAAALLRWSILSHSVETFRSRKSNMAVRTGGTKWALASVGQL